MAITRVVVHAISSNSRQPKPAHFELNPDQGALIPNIGDRYMAPEFSMDVVRRKFEIEGETLNVFLQDF